MEPTTEPSLNKPVDTPGSIGPRRCPRAFLEEVVMLSWALVFLVIAIIAAVLGFGGIAASAAGIAKILFFIFLVLFVISAVMGATRRGA